MALQLIDNILVNMDDSKDQPTLEDRFAVKKLNIDGLCAAVYTPFNVLNQINVSVVSEQAAYLNKTGVKAVFVAGTTGECTSLSISEKKQLLKTWMDIAPKYRLTVIFNVETNCLKDASELAVYAESIGVDAIALMPQSFVKPSCIESLIMTCKHIADCVPLLPVYYYHNPSMTGVSLSMYDFILSADKIIPNLVGIMDIGLYDTLSFPILQKILNYKSGERFEIIAGKDEMIVQCLVSGAVGFVGAQYNFAGALYNTIIKQFETGHIKDAQQLALHAIALRDIQMDNIGPNKNVGKYIMNVVGVNVGGSRLPFLQLNDSEKDMVQNELRKWCQDTSNAFVTL